jgi:hypothetical protein
MASRWTPSKYVEYGLKEAAYEWTQTPDDVTVTVRVPGGLRAKDIEVVFRPQHLRVAVKSNPAAPIVDGDLTRTIDVEESTWTKSDDVVEITLAKGAESKGDEEANWWAAVIRGHREVDIKAIASTKFLDESLLKRIWEEKHAPKDSPAPATPSAPEPQ